MGQDSTVLLICITVFLSYLPEAGQYSSFFLYLRQVNTHSLTLSKNWLKLWSIVSQLDAVVSNVSKLRQRGWGV